MYDIISNSVVLVDKRCLVIVKGKGISYNINANFNLFLVLIIVLM